MAYVPDAIIDRCHELSAGEQRVMLAICRRADKEGHCFPSLLRIAKDIQQSNTGNVARWRASLVRKGLISFDPATGVTSVLMGYPLKGNGGAVKSTAVPLSKQQRPTVKSTAPATVESTAGHCQINSGATVDSTIALIGMNQPMNQPIEPAHSELRHVELAAPTSTTLFENGIELSETTPRQNWGGQVQEVMGYYRARMNHPKAKLDAKRQRAVEGRLKDGFSVDQLKAAIDGCAQSPWHQGGNPDGKFYDDLELICRNAGKVEGFITQGDKHDGLPKQERQAPLSNESQRLIRSFAAVTRTETDGDNSGIAFYARPSLLR